MSPRSKAYDLAIVGAGITGLGVFEAAAAAGLKTLLIERDRPGRATTSATSRLLHGGLRYLTYDARTSLEMSREAGRLSAEFPALARRTPFLWPVYAGHRFGMETVEALLELYDSFAALRRGLPHLRLSPEEALSVEPRLRREGLRGGLVFDEWSVSVGGLVEALLAKGRAAGGEVLPGCRAVAFKREGGRILSVSVRGSDGAGRVLRAKVFVNAAGPWAEAVAAEAGCRDAKLTLRKGVQLVIKDEVFPCGLIFPGPRGRTIGLYPGADETRVGPTDEPYAGAPEAAAAAPGEDEVLRAFLREVLPGCEARSRGTTVGLRPLFRQSGLGFLLSRDFKISDHAAEGVSNFISVIGGKLTTFRPMAAAALAVVRLKAGLAPQAPPGRSGGGTAVERLAGVPRALGLPVSAALLGGAFARRLARRAAGRRAGGLEEFRSMYAASR